MKLEAPAPAPLFSQPPFWVTTATFAAVLGAILILFWPRQQPKSDIRVHNASAVTLRHLVVGRTSYGDVPPQESTPYQSWGPAYPHASVEFDASGIHMQQIAIDHVGETVLGAGRFTYVITVSDPKSAFDFIVAVTKD